MPTAASVRNLSPDLTRAKHDDLQRRQLLALKEIQQTGRATNRTMAHELLDDDMISEFHDGTLQLTAKGRRMLVRGSPSLWNVAL